MDKKSIEYAAMAIDTITSTFTPKTLPPSMLFHYHQGVFLRGVEEYLSICNNEKYYNYLKEWVDLSVTPEGKLENAKYTEFDDLQPLNLVFGLYEKTGDKKYIKALDSVMPCFLTWRTNSKGGFWHKVENPNQMWLDSLYMAGPLGVHYGVISGKTEYIDIIFRQLKLMRENMTDARTGLLYHAWDESKTMPWADKKTGLAPCFWGRSIGWLPAAMVDMLDFVPVDYPQRSTMITALNELVDAVCQYQDKKNGMWYQILNRENDKNNWHETSCSCLFAYSILKAVRNGYIDKKYAENAKLAYKGVLEHIRVADDLLFVDDICIGTGVLNYEEYINRPTSTNDLHGMGAFIMMCCEYHKVFEV